MLVIPPSVKIYLATQPADLRRSFDGLLALIERDFGPGFDPFSGHLFLFRNRRGDSIKMIFWNRSGFWICYTRLEKGTFKLPVSASGVAIEIESGDLALLLEGIDLAGARRRARIAPRVRNSPATTC